MRIAVQAAVAEAAWSAVAFQVRSTQTADTVLLPTRQCLPQPRGALQASSRHERELHRLQGGCRRLFLSVWTGCARPGPCSLRSCLDTACSDAERSASACSSRRRGWGSLGLKETKLVHEGHAPSVPVVDDRMVSDMQQVLANTILLSAP